MHLLKRTTFVIAGTCIIASLTAAKCGNSSDRESDKNVDTQPGSASQIPVRKTAASHPIQYFISVPRGWPGNRKWPVVMTLTGASKDWEENARLFAAERDSLNLPFILVTPVIMTNGGDGPIPRDHPKYQYPAAAWDLIEKGGRCAFDMAGVEAVIADVEKIYSGQPKAFLTAWSGGGHQGWATVLLRPELLRGAALVGTNYSGRCVSKETMTPQSISAAPERVALPIRHFNGAQDPMLKYSVPQQATAIGIAKQHGYTNISEESVPGIAHNPMPKNVLTYFASLLRADEK